MPRSIASTVQKIPVPSLPRFRKSFSENQKSPFHRFHGSENHFLKTKNPRSLKTENRSGARNPEPGTKPGTKIPLFFNAISIFSYFS